jgi:hypothetical protein
MAESFTTVLLLLVVSDFGAALQANKIEMIKKESKKFFIALI